MSESTDTQQLLLIGRLEGKMDLMVQAVNALSSSFESLEKRRLSRAEIAIAEMKTQYGLATQEAQTKAVWMAIFVSAVLSVVGGVAVTLILKLVFHI